MIFPERTARRMIAAEKGQQGQAIVEGVVMLIALLSLWVAISWLGRLQDIALQADHASRHAAFALTRQHAGALRAGDMLSPYIFSDQHRWRDASGRALQAHSRFRASWTVDRQRQLGTSGQVGADEAHAARLRRDWRVHDEGMYRSQVAVSPGADQPAAFDPVWWRFSLAYPTVVRSTSILAGVGHAAGDRNAQTIMGSSGLAWADQAHVSHDLAASITDVMQAVDQPWPRAVPESDWLDAWADLVPGRYIAPAPGSGAGAQP